MLTYEQSGVNIDEGNRAVNLIKNKIKETYDKNVIGDLGNFSGLYSLKDFLTMKEPVLLAATDGVGTKLKLAQMMDKHDTVGIDLVAMSVNDLICQGAKPLLFLDYIAIGKLVPEHIDKIVEGVANGCQMSGCALIGGETAEMPGMYSEDEYDLAGFAVGIADKEKIVSGQNVKKGDVLIGISSSGVHSNGFSFVRKIFLDTLKYDLNGYKEELGMTLGEALLTPTKIYVKLVLDLLEEIESNYKVDKSRIYLVGYSMGASTAQNLINLSPKKFAAIVSVSAVPDFSNIKFWKKKSILLIHGENDIDNPYEGSEILYSRLKGNKKLFFKTYSNLNHHNITIPLLLSEEIPSWLFNQKK